MVLLYLEKNSTATNKPGAENCQSTSQPILFCYIIWMRNGNIFDDCLNIIHITIKKLKKKKLYGPFLWMGFNCLKASATSRRQFTFYH